MKRIFTLKNISLQAAKMFISKYIQNWFYILVFSLLLERRRQDIFQAVVVDWNPLPTNKTTSNQEMLNEDWQIKIQGEEVSTSEVYTNH